MSIKQPGGVGRLERGWIDAGDLAGRFIAGIGLVGSGGWFIKRFQRQKNAWVDITSWKLYREIVVSPSFRRRWLVLTGQAADFTQKSAI